MAKSGNQAGLDFSKAAIPKRLVMSLAGGAGSVIKVPRVRVPPIQKGRIATKAPNLVGSSSGKNRDRRAKM